MFEFLLLRLPQEHVASLSAVLYSMELRNVQVQFLVEQLQSSRS